MDRLVATLVRTIHLVVVLGVVVTPFVTKRPEVLVVHVAFMIGMMVHWVLNADTCALTLLEAAARGVAQENTFVFSVVAPIYKVPITMRQQRVAIWLASILLTLKSIQSLLSVY